MGLSLMSNFFYDVVRMFSGKILIRLNDGPFTAVQIMELFGKQIQRLEIIDRSETTSSKLEKYLQLIIEYCEKDKLTELHLDLGKRGPKCKQIIINESMAYFTKINKLTIKTPRILFDYEHFLTSISYTAKHLQHLKFNGGVLQGSWSQLSAMNNLLELQIHSSGMLFEDIDPEDFKLFLLSNPLLEVFDVTSRYGCTPKVIKTLVNSCPNLKVFGDRYTDTSYMYSYDRIGSFKHLREIALTTYGNFGNIRQSLANITKKLEKIELFYPSAYSAHVGRTDGFNANFNDWLHSTPISFNFGHKWEYGDIENILRSLNDEKRSSIRSMRLGISYIGNSKKNYGLTNLIEQTPKLETLDIVSCVRTCSCSNNINIYFVIQIIRKTLEQQQSSNNKKAKLLLLRLILNQKTWNEIQSFQIDDLWQKISIEMLPY